VLIDVAFSRNKNVIKKLDEKFLKCKGLVIEILRIWIAKANMIPVKIGAIKTIQKSIIQSLNNTSGRMKSRKYKNSPNGQCTHFGKC
jgi:hypothetical protein